MRLYIPFFFVFFFVLHAPTVAERPGFRKRRVFCVRILHVGRATLETGRQASRSESRLVPADWPEMRQIESTKSLADKVFTLPSAAFIGQSLRKCSR